MKTNELTPEQILDDQEVRCTACNWSGYRQELIDSVATPGEAISCPDCGHPDNVERT